VYITRKFISVACALRPSIQAKEQTGFPPMSRSSLADEPIRQLGRMTRFPFLNDLHYVYQ
jgi:hypothetical protein